MTIEITYNYINACICLLYSGSTATEERPNKRRKDEDEAGDHAKKPDVTTNTSPGAVEEVQVEHQQAQKQQQAVTPDDAADFMQHDAADFMQHDAAAFTPAEASLETLGDYPSAKLWRDARYSSVTEDLFYGPARYSLQVNSCLLLTLRVVVCFSALWKEIRELHEGLGKPGIMRVRISGQSSKFQVELPAITRMHSHATYILSFAGRC